MNIFLQDPNEIRLPPDQVRLTKVQATPLPDDRRVKVHLELTPFMKRPNIEVTILSSAGKEVGHTSILEIMQHELELIIHLRQVEPGEQLTMQITVYYQKLPEPSEAPLEVPLPEPMIVDTNKTIFSLPQQ